MSDTGYPPPPSTVPSRGASGGRTRWYLLGIAAALALALWVTGGILGAGFIAGSITRVAESARSTQLYRTAVARSIRSDGGLSAAATVSWENSRCTFQQNDGGNRQQMTCTTPFANESTRFLMTDRYVYTIGDGSEQTYYQVLDVRSANGASPSTQDLRTAYGPLLGKWEAYDSSKTSATWFGLGTRDLGSEGPWSILAGVQHIFQASYFDQVYGADDQRAYLRALDDVHPFVGRGVTHHVEYGGVADVTRLTMSVSRSAFHAFDKRLAATLSSTADYVADTAAFDDAVFGATGTLTAQVYVDAGSRIIGVTTDMPLSHAVDEDVYGTTMRDTHTDFATLYGEDNGIDVPNPAETIPPQEYEKRFADATNAIPTSS